MNQEPHAAHQLSIPTRACWMLLPVVCGLFSLLAFKLLFLYLQSILFFLIWALIVMRKRPGTIAGQAAESFLLGFLGLFGLYLFLVGATWLSGALF